MRRVLLGRAPRDVIIARGHDSITATNRRAIEITKDPYVTKRGDCIIACCAERAAGELSPDVLKALASGGVVVVMIDAGGLREIVTGRAPRAVPLSSHRVVIRRSEYVDSSTVAVRASKAAADLSSAVVARLRSGIPVRVVIGACP